MDIIVSDCNCPMCGASEVANPEETDIMKVRVNVRGFKVFHSGLWWSECLVCKEAYGNGWFAYDESQDAVIIESPITAALVAGKLGKDVELIEGSLEDRHHG